MPRQFVAPRGQQLIDRNPNISIDDLVAGLADRFDVSAQAMRYRLVTLGVLEPG
jgi:phage shock protein PspC (stress-responsive transcriptional regulator)